MVDDIAFAEVAINYLLETGPFLVLRIDSAARPVDANALARTF